MPGALVDRQRVAGHAAHGCWGQRFGGDRIARGLAAVEAPTLRADVATAGPSGVLVHELLSPRDTALRGGWAL